MWALAWTFMYTVSPTGSSGSMGVVPTGTHAAFDLWNHHTRLNTTVR